MLKYLDTEVTFAEVPDEISLCINITNCPHNCLGCHSPQLHKDIGDILNINVIDKLINDNKGISCICFLGGDSDIYALNDIAKYIKENTNLKVCWYTGMDFIPDSLNRLYYDYIKYGHYEEKLGPLTSKKTNQVFLKKIDNDFWENITTKFHKD